MLREGCHEEGPSMRRGRVKGTAWIDPVMRTSTCSVRQGGNELVRGGRHGGSVCRGGTVTRDNGSPGMGVADPAPPLPVRSSNAGRKKSAHGKPHKRTFDGLVQALGLGIMGGRRI